MKDFWNPYRRQVQQIVRDRHHKMQAILREVEEQYEYDIQSARYFRVVGSVILCVMGGTLLLGVLMALFSR